MGFSFGTLLSLGRTTTDGESFASKFGSLFQTDEQRLLAESAEADIASKSIQARSKLENIAAANLEARDANPYATPRSLEARSVDQTSPTASNVQFRTLAGGPGGSLKA